MLNGFTQACKLTHKTGRYIKQPMAQQQFITSTSQIELRALAWQGIQASTCYEQLVYILQTKLSPSHAALLAQPVMDTSNPKYGEKEVDWYFNNLSGLSGLSGLNGLNGPSGPNSSNGPNALNNQQANQNHAPTKLLNLPANSQAMLRQTFMQLGQDIYNLAQSLKLSPNSNTVTAGNLLELAISFPSEDYLYAVESQPVLVAWGFAPASMGAQPETLTRIRPAPLLAGAAAGLAHTEQEAATSPPNIPLAPQMPQTNIQEERKIIFSSMPWAILAFLLGALLCALLLFWLLPNWGNWDNWDNWGNVNNGDTLNGDTLNFGGCTRTPAPLLNASTPKDTPHPEAFENNDELLKAKQREQLLREELRHLEQELRARMAKCPQPQKPEEAIPALPLPEEIIPDLAPLNEEPNEKPEALPELEPDTVPPVPDMPLPNMPLPDMSAEPEPQPITPETQEPETQEPEPQEPENPIPERELPAEPDFLEIPNNPKELGFLEGCWDAKIGLKNRQTGQPVIVEYCFDQSGNGTVNITERDRNGKIIQKCTGRAKAIVQGDNLQINDNGAQCPDGKFFGGNSVICRNNENQAQCSGQSQSGEKWGPVPFSTNRP